MIKSAWVLLLSFGFSFALLAQQSSKSKSSDKLYERGNRAAEITVRNANTVNTEHLEYSPQFYQNGIVFVTTRMQNGPIDKKINERFMELYFADTDRNGMPLQPEPFSVEINSQKHEGPVSFSSDMKRMFFTRNNLKNGIGKANSRNQITMKIYEAERGYFDWENVKELPFNSDEYNCMHPALSPDGSKLFFVSDMPGGMGATDLYVSEKAGDTWSAPKNLGPKVNTPGKEGFPFVHHNGNLFFASQGHNTTGGYDIFTINMNQELQVVNLGPPFNSPYDDLGFILNEDGNQGFFSSNREGGFGKDDIYTFDAPNGIFGVEAPEVLNAKITVLDAVTHIGIQGAQVRILEKAADGFLEGNELYDVEMVPNPQNPNELVLKLIRRDIGEIETPYLSTNVVGEAFAEMVVDKQFILLVSKEGYETSEMMVSTLETDEAPEVTVLLKKPACITLTGVVTTGDNKTGVADATVTIINNCDNTAQIVKTNDNGEYEYCLPVNCDFSITAEKNGFNVGTTAAATKGMAPGSKFNSEISLKSNTDKSIAGPVETGDVIVLQNIYYDFGRSVIRSGAARELDALATLMKKYPSMEIELIAHTDCRGSTESNMELSLARAESAKRYLVNNGIEAGRIKAFGYGESQPRNHCVDGVECDEADHAFNRRSEVRITRIDNPVKVEYKVKKP